MLEIKQDERGNLALFLNGIEVEDTTVIGKSEYGITVSSFESSQQLSGYTIKDFPKTYEFAFNPYKFLDKNVSIDIDFKKDDLEETDFSKIEVHLYIIPQQLEWKSVYTISEYRDLIVNSLKNLFNDKVQVHDGNDTNEKFDLIHFSRMMSKFIEGFPILLVFTENFSSRKIAQIIEPYLISIEKSHQECVINLLTLHKPNSVNSIYTFPEELKSSCEQYLIYFAQFLQDLGINATSNLKEEAGKVLFSVTPTDDIEALDKIREALAVYLHLPSSPIVYDDSFAAMRLQQQIENLQHSQRMAVRELQFNEKLLIAQSETIREKNVTISQLQSVTENQNKIIEKISSQSIMMDSAENKEELEKIYDGLEIGYSKWLYEKTGIKANPVKSVKTAVQNMLGKNDETIIKLKLNEQTENEDR